MKHDINTEFQAFWKKYPRKVGKRAARLKFWKASERDDISDIMKGLDRALIAYKDTETKFIPHASTWLHRDGWLDEVEIEAKIENPHEKLDYFCDMISGQFKRSQQAKGNYSKIEEICEGKHVIDNWLKTTIMTGWDRCKKTQKIISAMKAGTVVTSFVYWERLL